VAEPDLQLWPVEDDVASNSLRKIFLNFYIFPISHEISQQKGGMSRKTYRAEHIVGDWISYNSKC
jgi:hypothetical protein